MADPPADADREANAKEQFVAAPRRPPLARGSSSTNAADLKERMTYKFYRMVFRIPKNADLADAAEGPGVHRQRTRRDHLRPEVPRRLRRPAARTRRPRGTQRASSATRRGTRTGWRRCYDKLYDGCREHAEAHADLYKELTALNESVVGKPSPKMKRKIEEAEKKLDENWEWFKSFDRRVYLLHVQMAAQVEQGLEATNWSSAIGSRWRCSGSTRRRGTLQQGGRVLLRQDALQHVAPNRGPPGLRRRGHAGAARRRGRRSRRSSRTPGDQPAGDEELRGGREPRRASSSKKMVPEPPLSYVKGDWCQKLMTSSARCGRSASGCTSRASAASWRCRRRSRPRGRRPALRCRAEIVDPETILAAEAIPAEVVVEGFVDELPAEEVVIAAEVVPAEVAVESFVEALPVDDIEDAPPLVSAGPAVLDPTGAPMAAFMSAAPASAVTAPAGGDEGGCPAVENARRRGGGG